MLHFPCEGCYVSIKTLAVGTLCQLCSSEPDVAVLAMHLNLAPALLRAASSRVSTVYLKVCRLVYLRDDALYRKQNCVVVESVASCACYLFRTDLTGTFEAKRKRKTLALYRSP